jgi:DNA-binding MarR family transcriptional regulator
MIPAAEAPHMAAHRLSHLQRRILTWLVAEDVRTRGTMAASHQDLVRALAHHPGNLSTSLKGLEAKGLVRIARTPGGKAEAVDLTAEGRARAEVLNKDLTTVTVVMDDATAAALQTYAERHRRTPETQIRIFVREYLGHRFAITLAVLLLLLASPALAATTRCTTSEEKTLGRLQTLCDDGTRGMSTWNRTLARWDTTITQSPRQPCMGPRNPRTRQVEMRCR